MKIYISGNTSGVAIDVEQRFHKAEELLSATTQCEVFNSYELGFLDISELPKEDVVEWFKLLLSCDAIYLIDGWFQSSDCITERGIMQTMQKMVLYENPSPVYDSFDKTEELRNCLHVRLGYGFDFYRNKGRTNEEFFAKSLFCHYCFEHLKIKKNHIAKILNQSHSNILHALKLHDDLLCCSQYVEMKNELESVYLKQ
ncbi:DUF4406 domain-containing protein [Bacteroides sp. 214]|uniref:DUF4406 domain-containing protein n=1 Tax=Bacteroides sp. 214 TaxID=2302935 RepID=UPI0013D6C591|nr:DUF4406 domain-containing protein [Bacteroides sp. 214]NDW11971.1 DUF4406 domain-containing protein [Bacteroides sp. 214]